MGVFDKLMSNIVLNDDMDLEDESYLDDEDLDEGYDDGETSRGLFPKRSFEGDADEYYGEESDTDAGNYSEEAPKKTPFFFRKKKTEQSAAPARQSAIGPKVSPMRAARKGQTAMEVCVIKPHSMNDSREIAETLMENCTVILNMEGLDLELAQRIIDFASGSCYSLRGNLQRISSFIYIITPASVDISGDFQEVFNTEFETPAFASRY